MPQEETVREESRRHSRSLKKSSQASKSIEEEKKEDDSEEEILLNQDEPIRKKRSSNNNSKDSSRRSSEKKDKSGNKTEKRDKREKKEKDEERVKRREKREKKESRDGKDRKERTKDKKEPKRESKRTVTEEGKEKHVQKCSNSKRTMRKSEPKQQEQVNKEESSDTEAVDSDVSEPDRRSKASKVITQTPASHQNPRASKASKKDTKEPKADDDNCEGERMEKVPIECGSIAVELKRDVYLHGYAKKLKRHATVLTSLWTKRYFSAEKVVGKTESGKLVCEFRITYYMDELDFNYGFSNRELDIRCVKSIIAFQDTRPKLKIVMLNESENLVLKFKRVRELNYWAKGLEHLTGVEVQSEMQIAWPHGVGSPPLHFDELAVLKKSELETIQSGH